MSDRHSATMAESPWWFDYNTGQIVRKRDGKRWPVEEIPTAVVHGVINVEALDQWVNNQPEDD